MTLGEKVSDLMGWITDSLTGGDYTSDPIDVFQDEDGYIEEGSALRKPEYSRGRKEERRNVTSLNTNYKEHEVKIIEPRSFGEAVQMVKHLKDKKTVVLNLHLLDKEQSQRTIDFVCGAAHALNGTAQKVGEMVFIFTPNNVALSVDAQAQSKFAESLWNKPL